VKKFLSIAQLIPLFNKWPFHAFARRIDKFLAIDWFNHEVNIVYETCNRDIKTSWINFARHLNINIIFDTEYTIPRNGPLQIVSTHRGEFLDIIILGAIIGPWRTDIKFIANSDLQSFQLFKEFCFFISAQMNSSISSYQQIESHLNKGNALCHFAIAWLSIKKNNSKKIKYHKPLGPLPYILNKNTNTPILPIKLKFKKTRRGIIFLYLEEKLLNLSCVKSAKFLAAVDNVFSLRTLRAMQGKTVTVSIDNLITMPPLRLSRAEATQWVASLILP